VGFGSMIVASGVAIVAHYGAFGPVLAQCSAMVALALAIVLPPVVAWLTKGKYYIARQSELPAEATEIACDACGASFEPVDMASCPFIQGHICSLCCSTQGACHDMCKKTTVELGMPPVPAHVASGV
jgi:hypothetical protein